MRMLKILGLVVGVLLLPSLARAQGTITGVIKDVSGAVLPGVTVEATGPALLAPRAVESESNGVYRIIDLPPGTYTVVYTLSGFTKVVREGLEVQGTGVITIPIELRISAVAETITVVGETPVVDVQSAKRETVLRGDVIENLPGTHAYGAILNTIPGLTVDGNGLANTPTMTFFTARGGNTNEGRMAINGMVVAATFNGGGVSSLTYDANNVEEVSVTISGGMGESDVGGPVMNLIPKSGGNRFAGQLFYQNAGDWSRSDNLDDTLRNLQSPITLGPGIISSYDFNPSYGGPIKKDKLWFWGSYRSYATAQGVEGLFANKYALDPAHWDYLKDTTLPVRNVQGRTDYQGRITAQVTPKNRVMFSHEYQLRCDGSTLTTAGEGCRNREADWIGIGNGTTTSSPEAATGYFKLPYYVTQATWTAPATSRMLLDAGFSRYAYWTNGGPGTVAPDGTMSLIPVTEQNAIDGHPANFSYRAVNSYAKNWNNSGSWRANMAYVTGAHSFKVGYQGYYALYNTLTVTNDPLLQYRFQAGVPNQFTFRIPMFTTANRTFTNGVFAQDTWTRGRLTLQGALRFDHAWSFSDGGGTDVTSRFNAAPITFPRTPGVDAFNDITVRGGVAYDVFGNGKTALKFNVGHYLSPATNDGRYTLNDPAGGSKIVTSVMRTWSDTNGNKVVDCDILSPAAQTVPDTCGSITGNNLNFGKTGDNVARVNPEALHGWGVRPNDWQWGINLQQELMPRVSAEVGFNHRSFRYRFMGAQGTITDNLFIGPGDYEKWTINAPLDPRLPDGGGYPITSYVLTAAASARGASNYITLESDYGPDRIDYWNGVDLTVNARLRSVNLQIGTSTGKAVTDNCATTVLVDSPDPRNCRSEDPFQTTVRGSASYTIPKVDVLIAATIRSQPGTGLSTAVLGNGAQWLVPNTVVQQLLGRLPPGALATGTTTVGLLDTDHRIYMDRRNQIDMRFAKIVRFKTTRTNVGVDLGNLLNSNQAATWQSTYAYGVANGGSWNDPATILQPRFARFSVTFNF